METRKEEILDLWKARDERIVHEQNKHNEERKHHALHAGTAKGTERAMRHTNNFERKRGKLVRRCKYYYEKILVKRSKVKKKVMTEDQRWDKYAGSVLHFLQETIHLKEIVMHRKPQQKFSLSVSKLHQVELMLEKLLTAARSMKLAECASKVKPVDQRIHASRTIMTKQLPAKCNEMKLLGNLEATALENSNFIKRLQMIEDKAAHEAEHGNLKEMTRMSAAEIRAIEITEASRNLASRMLNNSQMAERRIRRLNKRLYAGRDRQERAALFVQAVWNYSRIRTVGRKVRDRHLIIFAQCGYRRWHACRAVAALRVQRWLRHIKWSEKQMIKVRRSVTAVPSTWHCFYRF